tara:strand:- start:637 stop:1722 length:1086 start_codon:yes stop_codon:yes gene_type:complete
MTIKFLYKKIIILFFTLIYERPRLIKRKKRNKNLRVFSLIKGRDRFKIYSIRYGRIFTNSVHDAAYLYKNELLEGPSYQYRESKNTDIKNNSVLKNGTPKLLKKYKGKVLSILSGGAAKKNYAHWIFDTLSRLIIFSKFHSLKKIDYFYVPSYKLKFQIDTLKYFGIKNSRIIDSNYQRHIKSDHVFATDHPFSHKFRKIPPWIIKETRKIFLKKLKKNKKSFKKIYIDRGQPNFDIKKNIKENKNDRVLLNEREIVNYLKKKGFDIIKLHQLSFHKQVKIFNDAKIIVGLFGSGLANIAFCRPKTKIIEIKNNRRNNDYLNISKICKLNHSQISIKPIFKTSYYQNGILICPLGKLKKLL